MVCVRRGRVRAHLQPFGDVRSQLFLRTRAAFWAAYGATALQAQQSAFALRISSAEAARIALTAGAALTAVGDGCFRKQLAVCKALASRGC